MKNNNLLLAGVFVLVGAAVFVAVYFLLLQPEPVKQTPSVPDTTAVVPTKTKPDNARKPVRGREKTGRKPRRRAPERKIKGRVVDGKGDAVADASVVLYRPIAGTPSAKTVQWKDLDVIHGLIELDEEEWDAPRPLETWAETATSDAVRPQAKELVRVLSAYDGSFEIDVPRQAGVGPFQLSAERDGEGSGQADFVSIGQVDLVIQLGAPGAVVGRILMELSGEPVADARVVFSAQAGRFAATTDANGRFRVEGMVPGAYSVIGSKKGLTPLRRNRVEVEPDGREVELRMPRGTKVKIRACLIDDDNPTPEEAPPVAGAEVVLLDVHSLAYAIRKTDANGMAEFDSLPPGSYLMNGRKAGLVTFGELPMEITGRKPEQAQPLEFEAAVPTPVRVVDEDGAPVQGVQFYGSNWGGEWDQLRSQKLPGQTDADGIYTFEFDEIGPREMIWGFKDGYALVQAFPEEYNSGDRIDLVARKGLRVSGTVRNEGGDVIPNAIVVIEVEPDDDAYLEDMVLRVRTDTQGRYDFGHLQPGLVYLGAETESDWSDMEELELEAGAAPTRKDLVLVSVPEDPPVPGQKATPPANVKERLRPGDPPKDR